MAGFFEFDDESLAGFDEWFRSLDPDLRTEIRAWLEWVTYTPERPPAEQFAVFLHGTERLQAFRIRFKSGFACAEIAYAFNLTRASLSILAYDDHLEI